MNYKTPGVFIEEIPKFPPSIAAVATAIPAFIGYTERAEKDGEQLVLIDDTGALDRTEGVRITSMLEYETYFGGPQKEQGLRVVITETQDGNSNTVAIQSQASFATNPLTGERIRSKHNMYFALQAYFANGGGPCYIFSIGQYDDTPTNFPDDISHLNLMAALDFVDLEDEVTLLVFPEAPYVNVGTDAAPWANLNTVYSSALDHCFELKDRFTIMDVPYNEGDSIDEAMRAFRGSGITAENDRLRYGAAYYPNIATTFIYRQNEAYETDQVQIQRIVLNLTGGEISNDDPYTGTLNSGQLASMKEAIERLPVELPPSPIMAGIYARVDNDRGVWKAPANVAVRNASKPMIKIKDADQENMNIDVGQGKSVNAIRSFVGKGVLVWGARTLNGNDNEWRYVPVRRFFNFVEESTKKATEQFVFEPNDANTWTRLKSMIDNFLVGQWRAGALQGPVPEQAFFVKVGLGETMTAQDILEGRLIVEIGMAVVRPAEFIILRFMHKLPEA